MILAAGGRQELRLRLAEFVSATPAQSEPVFLAASQIFIRIGSMAFFRVVAEVLHQRVGYSGMQQMNSRHQHACRSKSIGFSM